MTTDLRPYRPSDRDAVVALSLRAWAPVFASVERVLAGSGIYERLHPDWRESQRSAVAAALDDDASATWVTTVENHPIGFATVRVDRAAAAGEIHMIAVDPDHQGVGVGSRLTDHAVAWMDELGLSIAMVETGGDPGHAAARRTYEKAGFAPLPVVRYFRALGTAPTA